MNFYFRLSEEFSELLVIKRVIKTLVEMSENEELMTAVIAELEEIDDDAPSSQN